MKKGRSKLGATLQTDKRLEGFFILEAAMKGIVIAATTSGSGKTTITLALLAALKNRGLKVAPFKVGPDFIDPGHHTRITGITSRNLDGWMLSRAYNMNTFSQHTQDVDIAVVEGVMGLFDGFSGRTEDGSTAQMAKWLGLPVLLVVNAKSMARSAAALVQGFERFDKDLTFAGVLFNNMGSERHLGYLKEALSSNVSMPCIGGIVHNEAISIPERHLGLFTQEDHSLSQEQIQKLADLVEHNVDIDRLLGALPEVDLPGQKSPTRPKPAADDIRIGVAMDNAFCFYYRDNLDILEDKGAELIYLSPMNENRLPEDLDGLYFGGGYPELFAPQLSENERLRSQIRKSCLNGMPIYGECGGFMYLGEALRDLDGKTFPMTGCLPVKTKMLPRLKSLGYREITLERDTIIGRIGDRIRGHEFHYSEIESISDNLKTVYAVTPRNGSSRIPEGYRQNRCLGSYVHLHFGSQPKAAENFIEACREYKSRKG